VRRFDDPAVSMVVGPAALIHDRPGLWWHSLRLDRKGMEHTRGAPYHPVIQGKIERYHRSVKNVVKLRHYNFPRELEQEIGRLIEYYNHERYHESLNNVRPVDIYEGRNEQILGIQERIKRRTLQMVREI